MASDASIKLSKPVITDITDKRIAFTPESSDDDIIHNGVIKDFTIAHNMSIYYSIPDTITDQFIINKTIHVSTKSKYAPYCKYCHNSLTSENYCDKCGISYTIINIKDR